MATEEDKDSYLKDEMLKQGVRLADTDLGNVVLFNILSFNDIYKEKNEKELKNMKYLAGKYNSSGLSILGVFAYDLQAGEALTNKQLARSLNKNGFIDDQGNFLTDGIKFLEKVSNWH